MGRLSTIDPSKFFVDTVPLKVILNTDDDDDDDDDNDNDGDEFCFLLW